MTLLVLAVLYVMFPALTIGARRHRVRRRPSPRPALIAWRIGFEWLTRQVGPRERLLLVGTSPAALALARELHAARELGVEIVGFVDADEHASRRRSSLPLPRHDRGHPGDRPRARRSTASWSVSPTRAASCRWTSCSR